MVMCLGQSADLHMTQLMPLPLTISKSRLVLPSWFCISGASSPKCVCVCVFVCTGH